MNKNLKLYVFNFFFLYTLDKIFIIFFSKKKNTTKPLYKMGRNAIFIFKSKQFNMTFFFYYFLISHSQKKKHSMKNKLISIVAETLKF